MSARLTAALAGSPLQPARDEAARAAHQELSKAIYQQAKPSAVERTIRWLQEVFAQFADQISRVVPGGVWGLVSLAVLAVLLIVLVRWKVGGFARSAPDRGVIFGTTPTTAAQHRAAADRAAEQGHWDDAVLERFRAVVRQLEERGIIDERAGRTADEAALDGGRVLPDCAVELTSGAGLFDDVVYGSVPAGPEEDRILRALDTAIGVTRRRLVPS